MSRAIALSFLSLLTACSGSGDGILFKDDLPTAEQPSAPAPTPQDPPGNIVEVATENGGFEVLLTAISAANLEGALTDEDASLTVFAPTDEAFDALPAGVLDELLADPDALEAVLTYHVLASKVDLYSAADLANTTASTLNGTPVALTTRDDGFLYVNLAKVMEYDIEASNGIIHAIDQVLLPPDLTPSELTIAEIAAATENIETLVANATSADLLGLLSDPDASLTIFAPTDAAFEALGRATQQYLQDNPDALASTLLYHVVSGTQLSSIDAIAATGTSLVMANDDEATIGLEDDELLINDSSIVVTDIVASNGIIHLIDTVLRAPSAEPASIAVTLGANGSFATLTSLIDEAGLTEDLSDPSANFTIFAPTDEAFAMMETAAKLLGRSDGLLADFTNGAFADSGALVDPETETYTFPTGAESWAGFANNADIYPISFSEGGSISFTASASTPTNVRFRFEANPYPDTEPSYETANVLVSGSTPTEYSVEIPSQGSQTFNSFLMYVVERDQPVTITDIVVYTADSSGGSGPVDSDLVELLTYHVYADTVFSDQVAALAGSSIVMLNGDTADISTNDSGDLFINDASVISADMIAGNGIIHAINKVLSLPGDSASVVADFTEGAFADSGALVDAETETYTFPTGAQSWAGYANNADIYPLSFPEGGTITFTASAATPTNVRFRFEANPYPNTEPSYDTENVLVDSVDPKEYSIEIPSQGDQTFNSFLMYVVDRDQPVTVTNVVVTGGTVTDSETETTPSGGGSVTADFTDGAFADSGALVDAETETYTFPADAQSWAGFANDADIYPLSFPDGGTITFTASAETPTNVRFRFEANPYPATEPSYNTENILVNSTEPAEYSVEIPSQGTQTFNSFLMYVVERDQPVMVTNVVVTSN